MNLVEQNIVKFVDALIVDNYSGAHKFLETIVNEKIKATIAMCKTSHPFKESAKPDFLKKGKDKDSTKKSKTSKTSATDRKNNFLKMIAKKKSKKTTSKKKK